MVSQNFFSPLREPLTAAQNIFIFLPRNPGLDRAAASLALFLSLQKANKQASVACPTEMTVEFSSLVGVDKIQTKPVGRNLVVSFDYREDSIEKVSYHIEDNKFNLVIQPKAGFPPLATEKVDYSYVGGEADLIFVIGVRSLGDLGSLSQFAKPSSGKQTVVDLNINPAREQLGQVILVDLNASSCSEIVVYLLSRFGLPIDEDIASNLLLGIEKMTKGFSSLRTRAATFEAAALCLRAGARRPNLSSQQFASRQRRPKKQAAFQPMSTEAPAIRKPEETKKPSPDWLEPKIYKGNTQI